MSIPSTSSDYGLPSYHIGVPSEIPISVLNIIGHESITGTLPNRDVSTIRYIEDGIIPDQIPLNESGFYGHDESGRFLMTILVRDTTTQKIYCISVYQPQMTNPAFLVLKGNPEGIESVDMRLDPNCRDESVGFLKSIKEIFSGTHQKLELARSR